MWRRQGLLPPAATSVAHRAAAAQCAVATATSKPTATGPQPTMSDALDAITRTVIAAAVTIANTAASDQVGRRNHRLRLVR